MNDYIRPGDKVLEIGAGIGVTKMFLTRGEITLSDVDKHPWLDRQENALELSYDDASLDVLIANNAIHHFPSPARFFHEAHRVLRPKGRLLIQDVNCSLMLRAILRLMRHETVDDSVRVFEENAVCAQPDDPWAGNNAVPNLLFDDPAEFTRHFPFFSILEQQFSEFFIFLLSGGVTAKFFTIPLPHPILKLLDRIDTALTRRMPSVFALQRRIVLENS
ncbi:MAG TPA: class I SAM-dependent methyltransferase [Kiritimatiellia bacterium]|nr:class I SAM-dependent methyltransferase [Kiritimatiellia bacterium]